MGEGIQGIARTLRSRRWAGKWAGKWAFRIFRGAVGRSVGLIRRARLGAIAPFARHCDVFAGFKERGISLLKEFRKQVFVVHLADPKREKK